MNKTLRGAVTLGTLGAVGAGAFNGTVTGGAIGCVIGAGLGALIGSAISDTPAGAMSDAEKKVDDVRLKMAQIASKALWRTMGRPGDVPWWFKDVRIAQDRDGNYFLKGIISDKLPMDDTGWPYGLPHTSEGVKVVAERQNPNSVEPVKLGPT